VVKAKLSPAQRPGGVTVYNGWDPFMFENWLGPNEVEPGLVKYLGLAGGYGHLRYGPMEWQPVPIDRAINVDIEAVPSPHKAVPSPRKAVPLAGKRSMT
jgi:hypothetical protein